MISDNDHFRIKFYIPLLCLLAIVYSSFIPFQFRLVEMQEALDQFRRIPYLDLQITNRADWIANILLYIPFGFSLIGWMLKKKHSFSEKFIIFFGVFLCCVTIAVVIEFCQIFISPRTVSLNDLIAETIGTCLGIGLWIFPGQKLIGLWAIIKTDTRPDIVLNAFMVLYLTALFCISLFPFDFLISLKEINDKCAIWMAAPLLGGLNFSLTYIIKTTVDAASYAPIGVFTAFKYKASNPKKKFLLTCSFSFIVAFTVEALQFFTASGVSHSRSIPLRVLGAIAGLFVIKWIFNNLNNLKSFMTGLLFVISPVYIIMVMKIGGWSTKGWQSVEKGVSSFDVHMLIPFYFHYFSTETRAVQSLILNFGMYIPIGFSGWFFYRLQHKNKNIYLSITVLFAFLFSFVIESGKLMQKGLHPDFTNVIVAVVSSIITFKISDKFIFIFHDIFDSNFITGGGNVQ